MARFVINDNIGRIIVFIPDNPDIVIGCGGFGGELFQSFGFSQVSGDCGGCN
jgi:hypothetical protein